MLLETASIEKVGANRYVYMLVEPGFLRTYEADTARNPLGSTSTLKEGGKVLGPAHALLPNVEALGAGRYAHRGRRLDFSSSDNSDPRANGREYQVRATIVVAPGVRDGLRYAGMALLGLWLISFTAYRLWVSNWLRRVLPSLRFYAMQLVITIAIVLAAVEVWARIYPPEDTEVWPGRFDARLGFVFKPNARVTHTNGLDFKATDRSNPSGFLDRPFPPAKRTPNECRVAFLGDSFLEAAQVKIPQKLQVLFERKYNEGASGRRARSFALGYSGTGQLNQIPFYDYVAKPLKPDVVVLVFVANDFSNNSALLESVRHGWWPTKPPRMFARLTPSGKIALQEIAPDWKRYRMPRAPTETSRLHNYLISKSRFYRWFYKKLELLAPGIADLIGGNVLEGDAYSFRLRYLALANPRYESAFRGWEYPKDLGIDAMFNAKRKLPPAFSNALRFTRFSFQEFKRRAARDGFRLLIYATYNVTGGFLQRLRDMARAEGIDLVSQADYLIENKLDPAKARWKHDAHWSPQGHIWAARQLADYFREQSVCAK